MRDTLGRIPLPLQDTHHRNYDASNRGPRGPMYDWEKGAGLILKCCAIVLYELRIGPHAADPLVAKLVWTQEFSQEVTTKMQRYYPKEFAEWVRFRTTKQLQPANIESLAKVVKDRAHKALRYDNGRTDRIGPITREHPLSKQALRDVYNQVCSRVTRLEYPTRGRLDVK